MAEHLALTQAVVGSRPTAVTMHEHVYFVEGDPHERVYCQVDGCFHRNPSGWDGGTIVVPRHLRLANEGNYTMAELRREDYEGMKLREANGEFS